MNAQHNLKKQFDEQGFIVVPLFSQEQISALREKVLEQFQPGRSGELYIDFYLKEMGDLPFILDDKLNAALKALDPSVIHIPDLNIQINRIDQFGTQQGWHVDCNFEDRQNQPYLAQADYRFLKVGIYLQDDTPEYGGGIDIQPGTHRLFEGTHTNWLKRLWKNFRVKFPHKFPYTRLSMKAGDAVLFDSRLIHRSSTCTVPTNEITKENMKVVLYWDVAGSQDMAEKFYYSLVTRVFDPRMPEAASSFWGNMLSVSFPEDFEARHLAMAEKNGVSFWSHSPRLSAYFKESLRAQGAENSFLTSSFPSHPTRTGLLKL